MAGKVILGKKVIDMLTEEQGGLLTGSTLVPELELEN
jgi:hypothetical protein